MATWGDILIELRNSGPIHGQPPDFDGVRRKYLAELHALTNRDTIIYYSDWLSGAGSDIVSITLEDVQALMEVCKGLPGPDLDLILHTPGGSAEATSAIVQYLRARFTGHIRAFVPLAAMSAGTMLALACDEIVMGRHSQLGPIDPQVPVSGRYTPARAIIEQFEQAKKETSADPTLLNAWFPILQQYGPGLLALCADAEQLSKDLVRDWLKAHMCQSDHAAADRAADFFGNYNLHRSHALGIMADKVRALGLNVSPLEQPQVMQDAVLSVHHATMHTFAGAAAKIVENHHGRAYVKMFQQVGVGIPIQ